MEEHGSNVALLRHREQEITELQTRETEAQEQLKDLRAEVRALKDHAMRSEHKVTLAEREVSFLQAMLVRHLVFSSAAILLTDHRRVITPRRLRMERASLRTICSSLYSSLKHS